MPILATREKDNQRKTVVFLAHRYFLRFFPDYHFGKEVIYMETETIGSRIRAARNAEACIETAKVRCRGMISGDIADQV